MSKMITAVLADAHEIIIRGVKELLSESPYVKVIGETLEISQLPDMVKNLHPDIVILDPIVKDGYGTAIIRKISVISPTTKIIVLTIDGDYETVLNVMNAGAKAYVLKTSKLNDLSIAIKEATANRRFLSPPLQELAISALAKDNRIMPNNYYESLTIREKEIFHLAISGYNNREIAARLFISRRTVENHEANLKKKLRLHTRLDQLREFARKQGIVHGDREDNTMINNNQ